MNARNAYNHPFVAWTPEDGGMVRCEDCGGMAATHESSEALATVVSRISAVIALGDEDHLNRVGWSGWDYSSRCATEVPEGGESAWCDSIDASPRAEGVDFFEVPMATWGDYCGGGVERSNFRSLERDYPETFVSVGYDYNGNSLLLPILTLARMDLDDAEALVQLLVGLREQYPLYDEEDHSALEMELADEAWDGWVRMDLTSDLSDLFGDDTDILDETADETLRELFYTAVSEGDDYPYLETADSVVFPNFSDLVDVVYARLTAPVPMAEPCSFTGCAGHYLLTEQGSDCNTTPQVWCSAHAGLGASL